MRLVFTSSLFDITFFRLRHSNDSSVDMTTPAADGQECSKSCSILSDDDDARSRSTEGMDCELLSHDQIRSCLIEF